MKSPRTIYRITAALFLLTALINIVQPARQWLMATVWIAISVTFFTLGEASKSRS